MTETHNTSELIDLVNELRKENEELKIELMAMRGAANSLKLHNGLLESERELHKIGASQLVLQHRAEAVKEFFTRLEDESTERLLSEGYGETKLSIVVEFADIERIKKEMVGE